MVSISKKRPVNHSCRLSFIMDTIASTHSIKPVTGRLYRQTRIAKDLHSAGKQGILKMNNTWTKSSQANPVKPNSIKTLKPNVIESHLMQRMCMSMKMGAQSHMNVHTVHPKRMAFATLDWLIHQVIGPSHWFDIASLWFDWVRIVNALSALNAIVSINGFMLTMSMHHWCHTRRQNRHHVRQVWQHR